jgi:hypothetical protein
MEDKQENTTGINVQAEKILLSGLIEGNQQSNNDNKDQGPPEIRAEALKPDFIEITESPVIDVQKMQTPEMASVSIESNSADKKIKNETDSIRSDINDTIIPMIINVSSALSNSIKPKDGDKILEQRINQQETNPVFIDRLGNITEKPTWA